MLAVITPLAGSVVAATAFPADAGGVAIGGAVVLALVAKLDVAGV
jgi:hypothetical protein